MLKTMASRQTENQKQTVAIAIMANDIGYIKKSIEGIEATLADMDHSYVKKSEIEPIHKDHEVRLRRVETWGLMAIGALSIVQFILNYFK